MNPPIQNYTILNSAEYRFTERGSKFLAWCAPVENRQSAEAAIADRARRHHDATHHCWAYRVIKANAIIQHSSDAGEPSGTAGRPILMQLQRASLVNSLIVVSRWFGGTKLGRGGLARAYGSAAEGVLELTEKIVIQPLAQLIIQCPYNLIGLVERTVELHGGKLAGGRYDTQAELTVSVSSDQAAAFTASLSAASGGLVRIILNQEA